MTFVNVFIGRFLPLGFNLHGDVGFYFSSVFELVRFLRKRNLRSNLLFFDGSLFRNIFVLYVGFRFLSEKFHNIFNELSTEFVRNHHAITRIRNAFVRLCIILNVFIRNVFIRNVFIRNVHIFFCLSRFCKFIRFIFKHNKIILYNQRKQGLIASMTENNWILLYRETFVNRFFKRKCS